MDEAGDDFVLADAQQRPDLRIVRGPAGQPLRAEAHRLRSLEQREADAAGGEQALLRGNFRVRANFCDDGHDRRREGEPLAILLDHAVQGVGVAGPTAGGEMGAKTVTGFAFYPEKPERRSSSMVGDPRRGLQHPQQRGVIGPWRPKLSAWDRAPRIQCLQHSGWMI